MSHHATSRRDYLLTTDGGCLFDYQFLEDSLHAYLQVIGSQMRTTFCICSPRASVLIVGVTDMQPLQELLHLLPSDSAMGRIILILGKEMLHPKLTEILRGNNGIIACFQGAVTVSNALQFMPTQEKTGYASYLCRQFIKVCLQNLLDEGDGI